MPDPISDVLRSPLDELDRSPGGWTRLMGYVTAGVLIGAAAGLGGAVLLAGAEAEGPATIATFAPEAPPAPEGLPPGFADTGLGYGVKAEWFMPLHDRLLVGVATAVPSDADRGDLRPIGSTILGDTRRAVGSWTLLLTDGRALEHRAEFVDDAVPGMVTIEFDDAALEPGDVDALTMAIPTGAGLRVEETVLGIAELPVSRSDGAIEIPATELIDMGEGGPSRSGVSRLVVDRLDADWVTARVDWHLEGAPGVGARVESVITIAGTVPEDEQVTLIDDALTPARFLQLPIPPATPARSGSVHLRSVGGSGPGGYDVTALEFTWTVTWARYTPDAFDVPIDVARWIVPGD